jgi:peptide/nickel transport system substrate-binding protein/oligopeptide transport system substrate-binding protein
MFTSQKRILLTCLSVLIALSMALSACSQATPTTVAEPPTSTPLPVVPTYTPIAMEATATTASAEPTEAPAPTEAAAQAVVNAWGVTLPSDAAPLDQQYIRI